MTMRRPQVVLIAFAIAAWLGAMFELGASASAGGDLPTAGYAAAH